MTVTVTVMVLRSKYRNAFLYDTLLQRLATDPRILGCEHSTCCHRAVPSDAERLPTDACQLLNNQPRLVSGTMMNQKAHHVEHGFHGQCAPRQHPSSPAQPLPTGAALRAAGRRSPATVSRMLRRSTRMR